MSNYRITNKMWRERALSFLTECPFCKKQEQPRYPVTYMGEDHITCRECYLRLQDLEARRINQESKIQ